MKMKIDAGKRLFRMGITSKQIVRFRDFDTFTLDYIDRSSVSVV